MLIMQKELCDYNCIYIFLLINVTHSLHTCHIKDIRGIYIMSYMRSVNIVRVIYKCLPVEYFFRPSLISLFVTSAKRPPSDTQWFRASTHFNRRGIIAKQTSFNTVLQGTGCLKKYLMFMYLCYACPWFGFIGFPVSKGKQNLFKAMRFDNICSTIISRIFQIRKF